VAGSCECGNELPSSIKCGKFLDWLRSCWLLKKAPAPWRYLFVNYLFRYLDSGQQPAYSLGDIYTTKRYTLYILPSLCVCAVKP
jgi:hypothetical protein